MGTTLYIFCCLESLEDSFQKERPNNTFKIVLNMQLRRFSSPFQSFMSGSIPELRRSGWKALFKVLHQVTEHDCGMRLLSSLQSRRGRYFSLGFQFRPAGL